MQEATEKIEKMNEEIKEKLKTRESENTQTIGERQTEFIKSSTRQLRTM